jgi:hypothetical protein
MSRHPTNQDLVRSRGRLLAETELSPHNSAVPIRRTVIGLFQLAVLGFSLFEDGEVGVGVFPEGKEILVGDF